MFTIALVNMPTSPLNMPSIALTQLKSVVTRRFGDQVTVDIRYVNHDFAHFVGLEMYQNIVHSGEHFDSGIGDWFFRQAAFPDLTDNTDEYLRRCYAFSEDEVRMFTFLISEKRRALDGFLDSIVTKYRLDQAAIVGFTSMFTQSIGSLALARHVRDRNPDVITVMGGANCEAPMGLALAEHATAIDYVFSGPALKTFPEFVAYCMDGARERCDQIPGVFSRARVTRPAPVRLAGPVVTDAMLGEELPIDDVVNLDYDSFLADLKASLPQVAPLLLFETSRGCWWGERAHCTFCGLNGGTMAYRAMEPGLAVDYIQSLFRYADRCVSLNAVDNIMPKAYPTQVFPRLDTPGNVNLFYEVKADVSESDVQSMARAGVRAIQPGIEALATSTLKLMKKGTSVFQNLTLLKYCATYGIYPTWLLLIGFPGEEEAVFHKYEHDIPALMHLPPPGGVFQVRFDRYSPYFMQAEHFGLDLKPYPFYELTYPFGKDAVAQLAYYFEDDMPDAPYRKGIQKWRFRLDELTGLWRSRWRDQCQSQRPRLCFENGGGTRIVDTRGGMTLEHTVSDAGLRLLRILDKPRRLAELAGAVDDVDGELASLMARHLVFEEDGRFLNLVCEAVADCRADHVAPMSAAGAAPVNVARCEW